MMLINFPSWTLKPCVNKVNYFKLCEYLTSYQAKLKDIINATDTFCILFFPTFNIYLVYIVYLMSLKRRLT